MARQTRLILAGDLGERVADVLTVASLQPDLQGAQLLSQPSAEVYRWVNAHGWHERLTLLPYGTLWSDIDAPLALVLGVPPADLEPRLAAGPMLSFLSAQVFRLTY